MDIEEIKTLTELMVARDLTEIMIRDGETRILLRRGDRTVVPAAPAVLPVAAPPEPAVSAAAPVAAAGPPPEDPNLAKIVSPMVGTFYAAPDPDSPPYVNLGDTINANSVVCILEAMKVFNEIKAEVAGTIESIEIKNGDPVEFGQVLMTVRVA